MTNDAQIRFRTFADDDTAVNGSDDHQRPRQAGPAFEDDDGYLGAALPPNPPRRAGSGSMFVWGTGLALVAGVVIAVTLLPKPGPAPTDGEGLRVHRYVAPQPGRLASSALLPCYVAGVSVGSRTLADCGQRNGVASGRLDVGSTPSPAPTPVAALSEQLASRAPPIRDAGPPTAPSRPPAAPSYVPPAYAEDDQARPNDRLLDPEDSVRAAQTFYEGLAAADGDRAASVVVPEKRRQGPLSAGAISRFYSGLQAPLRLTRLYPVDDHTVVARYAFVDRDGETCQGAARVTTTERDGEVYVQAIKALNGC